MSNHNMCSSWSPYFKVYEPLKAGSIDGTDTIPHDSAIIRALCAEYKPPDKRLVTSDPLHTLFVGRLNLKTSDRQLEKEFSQYGDVKSCRLVRDIVTGSSRGYAFVEFKWREDAERAWMKAHNMFLHDRQIIVEWEFARTMPGWVPRRLGGGLGGKKESGQLRFGGRDRPFRKPLPLLQNRQFEHQNSPVRKTNEEQDGMKSEDQLHHGMQDRNVHRMSKNAPLGSGKYDFKSEARDKLKFGHHERGKNPYLNQRDVHFREYVSEDSYRYRPKKSSQEFSSRNERYAEDERRSFNSQKSKSKHYGQRNYNVDDDTYDSRKDYHHSKYAADEKSNRSSYSEDKSSRSKSRQGRFSDDRIHYEKASHEADEHFRDKYSKYHRDLSNSEHLSNTEEIRESHRVSHKKRKRKYDESDLSSGSSPKEKRDHKKHKKLKKKKKKKRKKGRNHSQDESSD